jgi:hypothetical protein
LEGDVTTKRLTWRSSLAALLMVVAGVGTASAQDAQEKPEAQPETGLPPAVSWAFNFDAGWGFFGFGGSLFTGPKEGVVQDYGDRWMEGFIKPALSGSYTLRSSSQIYGTLSAVGERTYANAPLRVGLDNSSFLPEDLAIGWRSGNVFDSLGENALDVVVGRVPYTLGRGLLLWDGAAEGGSRGGYWSNARKAFEFGAIARFKPRQHTLETFYLAKDDLPENETASRVWGANYEFRHGEHSTFAATYMRWQADRDVKPQREGLDVYNLRAYTAPIPAARNLSFELEYAAERNDDVLSADAWAAGAGYELSAVTWTPTITYRYAFFEGDDPSTAASEAFDPLFTGFSDWGSWWQGEIAGEYFLANSNLRSHLVRVHVAPSEALGTGLIAFKVLLDEPSAYAPGVTDRNLAVEIDWYADWKINDHFTASFVAAFANPQRAVQQSIGRTENFKYGMVFLAYRY